MTSKLTQKLLIVLFLFLPILIMAMGNCGQSDDDDSGIAPIDDDDTPQTDDDDVSDDDDTTADCPDLVPTQLDAKIALPPCFSIDYYAKGVGNARSMVISDGGTLFVGSRTVGNVYALQDTDGDFQADKQYTIASGLDMPNGVALGNGSLYVAENSRILRYDNIEAHLNSPPAPVVVNDDYPGDNSHGWKFIAFGPDDRLYVPVGAPCNICLMEDPIYASITRINADGSGLEVFASGIRNTVGFAWHPVTGDLWFTDNGRDNLGDDLPADELNRATEAGMHFGYPYCHQGDYQDPQFNTRPCSEFTPPAQKLGPHVAALGMRFYTGSMFPESYTNRIFIAEHGSWNRSRKIGYRVTQVTLNQEGTAAIAYEDFATGWLESDGVTVWGRPVDVLIMKDGSMLVSDDYAGAIYRIRYAGKK